VLGENNLHYLESVYILQRATTDEFQEGYQKLYKWLLDNRIRTLVIEEKDFENDFMFCLEALSTTDSKVITFY
jgi:hypothetical protein